MAFVLFNSADQRGNPNKLEERMRGEKHSIILGNIILSDSQPTRIDEEGYQVKDKGKVRGEKCVVSLWEDYRVSKKSPYIGTINEF